MRHCPGGTFEKSFRFSLGCGGKIRCISNMVDAMLQAQPWLTQKLHPWPKKFRSNDIGTIRRDDRMRRSDLVASKRRFDMMTPRLTRVLVGRVEMLSPASGLRVAGEDRGRLRDL
jgi:hypothetical protein